MYAPSPTTPRTHASIHPIPLQEGVQLVKGVVKEVREKSLELQVGAAHCVWAGLPSGHAGGHH